MSASPLQKSREWKPLEQRKCTDIPWLLLFILFNVGMLCICGFAIATGAASRLISGYDSYGNTCGQKNAKIPGIELSGRDHTSRKYVFFLDPCNIDILRRKIKSVALCVSKCPDTELKSYEDLRNFSTVYGSDLCSYDVQPDTYSSHANRSTKCPTLPVHPSASLPVFHRCMPVDISCYARFAEAFITFVSDNSVVHRVIAGVMTSKEIIMGLCLLALVINDKIFILGWSIPLSFSSVNIKPDLHQCYFSIEILLWLLYYISVFLQEVFERSVFPTGSPVQNNQTGLVEFKMDGPLQYMVWYHAVGLIWISEFILACQQMTVAGAVVTYYFTRDKSQMPFTPIVSSVLRLMRYHLGTVVKGAFIITLVEIPRLILTYIHSQLKGRENACARCMLKACICCLWCLEKCLTYLNMNAYTATAINSTNFCTSARDAFFILAENALRVAAINSVGDFVLFLGKVLIVSCTAFAGILSLNYQREYTVWVLPLIIVCVFSFLVAHCFLSIFEIVVDVLFLCFAIDTKYNDGSPGREYYMDKALMEFVENTRRATERYSKVEGESREMKSMVSLKGQFLLFLWFIFDQVSHKNTFLMLCSNQF
uniref:Choline transporter-like protein n=1 Tax=Cyprinus carpio TaxID=7962 RepID=A0A8C2G6N7_CYPCA